MATKVAVLSTIAIRSRVETTAKATRDAAYGDAVFTTRSSVVGSEIVVRVSRDTLKSGSMLSIEDEQLGTACVSSRVRQRKLFGELWRYLILWIPF